MVAVNKKFIGKPRIRINLAFTRKHQRTLKKVWADLLMGGKTQKLHVKDPIRLYSINGRSEWVCELCTDTVPRSLWVPRLPKLPLRISITETDVRVKLLKPDSWNLFSADQFQFL